METRKSALGTTVEHNVIKWYLTSASSGSLVGSNMPSLTVPGGAPSSPAIMADEIRASAKIGPGGTVTRWLDVPSLPFTVLIKVVKRSVLLS